MKKVKLNISDLRVESFETVSSKVNNKGTAKGFGDTYTCIEPPCTQVGCPSNDCTNVTCGCPNTEQVTCPRDCTIQIITCIEPC